MGWFRNLFSRVTPEFGPFSGAQPPNRFVVVRRPTDVYEYAGCEGAKARHAYEFNHPKQGEVIEIWENEICRGRK